jgi:hypothetical protein
MMLPSSSPPLVFGTVLIVVAFGYMSLQTQSLFQEENGGNIAGLEAELRAMSENVRRTERNTNQLLIDVRKIIDTVGDSTVAAPSDHAAVQGAVASTTAPLSYHLREIKPAPIQDVSSLDPVAAAEIPQDVKEMWKTIQTWVDHTHTKYTGHVGTNSFQSSTYVKALKDLKSPQVCETGFNGGHSAVLFLLSNKKSKYIGFDLGDNTASKVVYGKLKELFGDRFEVVWGDSRKSVPEYTANNPSLACDMLVIDGAHYYWGVWNDLKNLAPFVKPNAPVFCDDIIRRTHTDALQYDVKARPSERIGAEMGFALEDISRNTNIDILGYFENTVFRKTRWVPSGQLCTVIYFCQLSVLKSLKLFMNYGIHAGAEGAAALASRQHAQTAHFQQVRERRWRSGRSASTPTSPHVSGFQAHTLLQIYTNTDYFLVAFSTWIPSTRCRLRA